MDFRKLPLVALMSSQLVMASFNLFGPYDQEVAPASLGISRQCFAAVNQSVSCDPVNAVRAAHGVDDEYWFVDDITSLCTNECRDSLSAWLSTVDYECANEVLTMDDRPIEPKSFPLRYMAGFEIACLQDSAQNWCFFDSQQWEETASASWDPHPCRGDDPLAECGDEEIFITEHSPDMAVTDAYPQEIYCSECFILLWKQRILSPQVSDEIIDYLVEQLGMLEGSCSSSISLSATSTAIVERAMPPAIPTDNSWATAKASANLEARLARETYYSADTPTAPTHPGSIKPCGQYYNVAPGDTCNSVADRFGISVYDLRRYNKELARDCFNMWANYALCVAPVAKRPVLADGRCGPDNGNAECEGSSFGSCCNSNGRCEPCDVPNLTPSQGPATPTESGASCESDSPTDSCNPTVKISTDGTCGVAVTCEGSGFGDCCSPMGYCGSGPEWCGISNCTLGPCGITLGGPSSDGSCGPLSPGNRTCIGSNFGECCSKNGYCGSTEDYCGIGKCLFGNCQVQESGEESDEESDGESDEES